MNLFIPNKHLLKIISQYVENKLPCVNELHNLLKNLKIMIDSNVCYSTKYCFHAYEDDFSYSVDSQLRIKRTHNNWYLMVIN